MTFQVSLLRFARNDNCYLCSWASAAGVMPSVPIGVSGPKTECRIEGGQGSAEEQPSLNQGQERRVEQQRQHLRNQPTDHRVPAGLREQHPLGPELETVKGAHVPLAQLLDFGEVFVSD